MNCDLEEFGIKQNNASKELYSYSGEVQDSRIDNNTEYKYTQWSEIKNGSFIATGRIKKILPSGLYKIRTLSDESIVFNQIDIETDSYIKLDDSLSEIIISEINKFWQIKDKFTQYGFIHSRGYLLYGPPGSGKSILVKQIIDGIIKKGGIAFYYDISPSIISTALKLYRDIEPDRPIVIVIEDLDALIERYGESEILSFLDGETKVNNVLNIATTNYPEKLDKRIVSRPRRFDRIEKIGTPNDNIRREFFKLKAGIKEEDELNLWVNSTKGFSFAALSDLIISIKCFGYEFDVAINKLKKILDSKPSSEEFNSKPGFFL